MKEIKIKEKTKLRLVNYGHFLSSWDIVLNELMDHVDNCDKYWSEKN